MRGGRQRFQGSLIHSRYFPSLNYRSFKSEHVLMHCFIGLIKVHFLSLDLKQPCGTRSGSAHGTDLVRRHSWLCHLTCLSLQTPKFRFLVWIYMPKSRSISTKHENSYLFNTCNFSCSSWPHYWNKSISNAATFFRDWTWIWCQRWHQYVVFLIFQLYQYHCYLYLA